MKIEPSISTLRWTKSLLDWDHASEQARAWWEELEQLNDGRVDLVLKLACELLEREATIDDFFVACTYSGREGVKENLRFLDKIRQDKDVLVDEQPETPFYH